MRLEDTKGKPAMFCVEGQVVSLCRAIPPAPLT